MFLICFPDKQTETLHREEETDNTAQFNQLGDAADSHFYAYFMTMVVICIVGYLVFHNKQKVCKLEKSVWTCGIYWCTRWLSCKMTTNFQLKICFGLYSLDKQIIQWQVEPWLCLGATALKSTAFWDRTQCWWVICYWYFGEASCLLVRDFWRIGSCWEKWLHYVGEEQVMG